MQFCSTLSKTTEESSPILMLTWKDHVDVFLSEFRRLSEKKEETHITELGECLARIIQQKCPEEDVGTPEIELFLRTEKDMPTSAWKLMSRQGGESTKEGWKHTGGPILTVVFDSVVLSVIHICAKKHTVRDDGK